MAMSPSKITTTVTPSAVAVDGGDDFDETGKASRRGNSLRARAAVAEQKWRALLVEAKQADQAAREAFRQRKVLATAKHTVGGVMLTRLPAALWTAGLREFFQAEAAGCSEGNRDVWKLILAELSGRWAPAPSAPDTGNPKVSVDAPTGATPPPATASADPAPDHGRALLGSDPSNPMADTSPIPDRSGSGSDTDERATTPPPGSVDAGDLTTDLHQPPKPAVPLRSQPPLPDEQNKFTAQQFLKAIYKQRQPLIVARHPVLLQLTEKEISSMQYENEKKKIRDARAEMRGAQP